MRIRSVVIVAIIMACVLALVSCSNIPGTGSDTTDQNQNGNANQNSQPDNTQNEFFGKYNKIIYTDDALSDTLADVRISLMDIYGPAVTVDHDVNAEESSGEIAFGDTNRQITAKAKDELEKLISASYYDCGYIIYCDGASVAVYWQIAEMSTLAIADFIDECVDKSMLKLTEGTVAYELYIKEEYERDKYWIALEAVVDPDLLAAYKKAHAYYDGEKIIEWMANLYDPEVGGFYFSRSARDYEGFLPDIESTTQVISMLVNNGAMTNRNTQLPVELQIAMVDYAKSLQSPKDGYFYHPQWPQGRENLNVDRYGRDIASATGFITSFWLDTDGDGVKEQQRPDYCAPGSSKCARHYQTSESCSFPVATAYLYDVAGAVTVPLASAVSSAVSRVTASGVTPVASVSSHPDYSSRDAFSAWLEAYNATVKENSGNAHMIAELRYEIIKYGYMDIVLDHLDRVLEEIYNEQLDAGVTPSGVWQYEADYNAVWGLYKYLALYNLGDGQGRRIDIKYVPYMLDTCLKVIAMPADGDYHVNDVMNQWTAIQRVIENVKNHYGDAEAEKLYDRTRKNAAELVENSLEKVKPFKVEDGSFAYNISRHSPTTMYGVPTSLGLEEGDVNATLLACNMYRNMYTVFGYDPVPIFTPDMLDIFVDTVMNCEPIEKKELEVDIMDFENASDMQFVNFSAKTNEAVCEIREDPEDSTNNALYFASGTAAAQADSVSFACKSMGSNCNVTEFSMYISSDTDDGYLFQCSIGSSYIVAIYKSGDDIIIKDAPSTNHNNGHIERMRARVDEWFKVRIEYYHSGEDENNLETPKIKLFMNGELAAISENYRDSDIGVSPSNTFASVSFYSMRLVNTYAYFDDCYFVTESKTYSDTVHE